MKKKVEPIKVLMINQHFYPEIAATAQIMSDLAKHLTTEGMQVTILTGQPSYLPGASKMSPKEVYQGITIYRVPNTNFSRSNLLGRISNYLTFYSTALFKGLSLPRYDIVIALSTPPLIAVLGYLLKRLKRSKFVYWVQDIYPDVAISLGVLRPPISKHSLYRIAGHIYGHADAIVAIGEYMQKTLIDKGIQPNRMTTIHNWCDGSEIYPLDKSENPFVVEHGLEDQFIVSYSGNLGLGHDLVAVQDTMDHFKKQPELTWLFIGDGVATPSLQTYVRRSDISNARFLPYQPYETLQCSLNACDVSLILLRDELEGKMVPCKVYSALAVGKPVIAVCPKRCEVSDIIQEAQCGFVVPNHNAQKLIEVLWLLMSNPILRHELGANGRQYFMANFDRNLAMKRYTGILRKLIA